MRNVPHVTAAAPPRRRVLVALAAAMLATSALSEHAAPARSRVVLGEDAAATDPDLRAMLTELRAAVAARDRAKVLAFVDESFHAEDHDGRHPGAGPEAFLALYDLDEPAANGEDAPKRPEVDGPRFTRCGWRDFEALVAGRFSPPAEGWSNGREDEGGRRVYGPPTGRTVVIPDDRPYPESDVPWWGFVNGTNVRLRARPSTKGAITRLLDRDTVFLRDEGLEGRVYFDHGFAGDADDESGDGWIAVTTRDGADGWISYRYFGDPQGRDLCLCRVGSDWRICGIWLSDVGCLPAGPPASLRRRR